MKPFVLTDGVRYLESLEGWPNPVFCDAPDEALLLTKANATTWCAKAHHCGLALGLLPAPAHLQFPPQPQLFWSGFN